MCAFFDVINKFAIDNPSDIEGFLEQWDNSYCDLTIQTDDADGIQLLSIHKSKGLEYDNVLVGRVEEQTQRPDNGVHGDAAVKTVSFARDHRHLRQVVRQVAGYGAHILVAAHEHGDVARTHMLAEQPRKTNYRSERNIIDFNNSFFTHAAMLERQRIADAGSDMMAADGAYIVCR